ncbi:MAG: efflux RND transporter periplasmic adaptor subunit [Planctomycetota bacterium]
MRCRAALLALVALIAAGPAIAQGPPATVRVDLARMEPLETWRQSTGEIRAIRRSVLASEEEGLVIEIMVREGDAVRAGEVIAALDDTRAALSLRRAEAAVATSRAVIAERRALVENATRDLDRTRRSYESGGGNLREIDNAETALATANARLAAAEATLALDEAEVALAAQRVSDMKIVAPFAGRVVSKRAEAGQWVAQGDAVAEIVALDVVEAWIDVPERLIDRLAGEGGQVRVRVPALDREVASRSFVIVPDADPRSRLFPVRIRMENAGERLRPGMGVVGLTPTGVTEPTTTVHKDAMLRDDAGEFVFFAVPGEDGGHIGVPARVTRLFSAGDRVAVRGGALPPGAMVVVEGNERMFPTQPLQILNLSNPTIGAPPEGGAPDGGVADRGEPAAAGGA